MINLAATRRPVRLTLGLAPFLSPNLDIMNPSMPSSAPAGITGGGRALLAGATLLYAGLGVASTLFSYGVAKETKSSMVRTTGYILAGVGAITTLVTLVGGLGASALAGAAK